MEHVDGRRGFASKDVGGMRIIGAGGAGGAGYMDSASTIGGRVYNGMEMSNMDSIRRSETLRSRGMVEYCDEMAVPDMYLEEYFSQVSMKYGQCI